MRSSIFWSSNPFDLRHPIASVAHGTTIVTIHVAGLVPGRAYASHVHKLPCGVTNADGHFQQVPGAGSTPPNEIWLGGGPFSPNGGGIANENATALYTANSDAVSVVVHDLTLPAANNRVRFCPTSFKIS